MRSFLKWAGGKHRILPRIQEILPEGKRFVEPFVGSGCVFMNTDYPEYLMADINPDLITLYQILQESGAEFIDYCETFFTPETNNAETYYEHRDTFNYTNDSVLKSALFLYMNRFGFNGLCRYNSKGFFNVPFGRHVKPYFPRKEMMHVYEKSAVTTFVCADFESIMDSLREGDVVYCDPPYVPLNETAHFTSYSIGKFEFHQQELLAKLAERAAEQGIPVLISNHETAFTKQQYQKATIHSFKVQRNISAKSGKREKANELIAVFGQ